MLLFDPSYNTNVHPSHVLIFCVQGSTLNMIVCKLRFLDYWTTGSTTQILMLLTRDFGTKF